MTVVDGDTLDIASEGGGRVRIHRAAIGCPELDQPFGEEASNTVREIVLDKPVRVKVVARNQFGQFYAEVYLPDRRLLNEVFLSRRRGLTATDRVTMVGSRSDGRSSPEP